MDWEQLQATAFQVIAVLTLAMPALEKLVSLTATKVDDDVLAFIQKVLAYVPRVRLGEKK